MVGLWLWLWLWYTITMLFEYVCKTFVFMDLNVSLRDYMTLLLLCFLFFERDQEHQYPCWCSKKRKPRRRGKEGWFIVEHGTTIKSGPLEQSEWRWCGQFHYGTLHWVTPTSTARRLVSEITSYLAWMFLVVRWESLSLPFHWFRGCRCEASQAVF